MERGSLVPGLLDIIYIVYLCRRRGSFTYHIIHAKHLSLSSVTCDKQKGLEEVACHGIADSDSFSIQVILRLSSLIDITT